MNHQQYLDRKAANERNLAHHLKNVASAEARGETPSRFDIREIERLRKSIERDQQRADDLDRTP